MAEESMLVGPRAAAEAAGTSVAQIKSWMARTANPLPSIPVGKSGKQRRIVMSELPAFLVAEAAREAAARGRGGR